jgi:hypothetical protein
MRTALIVILCLFRPPSGQDSTGVARDTVAPRPPVIHPSAHAGCCLPAGTGLIEKAPDREPLRRLPNVAYSGGEYLKYDVHYSFVTAGDAYLTVTDTVYGGRKCHIVTFTLESKPFFDIFYKVRDRYRTIIDAEGLFPWRFEQQIREGGFSRDFAAEFDQRENVAKTADGEYPIPPYVHDIISAFYFARTVDYTGYRPGQRVELKNFYKDSTYSLPVKYKGRQTIEVDAGTFACIIIEPLITEGGLFKSDGKIYLWITDDERKMPVKVRTDIPIGTVESELTEFRGINGPLNSIIHD